MIMELRKDFTYSLVVPSSMGVRITPVNAQPVHVSDTFTMQATSAETNVATISSSLGLPVKVLTTFVKDARSPSSSRTTWQAGIWRTRARKSPRVIRGGIGTSSTLQTADTACAAPGYTMTGPEKSAGH